MPSHPIITYYSLHAVVRAVCGALRMSPLRMLDGSPTPARAYVAEVLTRAYPKTPVTVVLRWCGSRNIERDAAGMGALMSSPAWDEYIVTAGLLAIGRTDLIMVWESLPPEPPPPDPPRPAAVTAPPRPAPPPQSAVLRRWSTPAHPMRRVIVREVHGTVAMGEPPPGRSALDQRNKRLAAEAAS